MDNNCKECVYIHDMKERLKKNEMNIEKINNKLSNLEKNSAIDRERLENFNKTVEKIEKGIVNIEDKIEKIIQKPNTFLEKILSATVGSVLTFIIIEFLKNS